MVCHGGFSLDETKRRSWYNPEDILKNLHSGMVFADIGSGDGFFTLLAAKKVGANGKVYAADVDASGIEKLTCKAQSQGLQNITAKVGAAEEVVFCTGCVDMVFFSMVLHDFADPAKVLNNARQMIKPDGQLVNLDWKKLQMPFGPPAEIRFSEAYASELMVAAGFDLAGVESAGLYHYIVTAKPRV
jgi:ubiquinone/menaquinone biosynthesis C-methylase UbiE